MSVIHYNACPACGDADIEFQLNVRDHSVSHESFPVWECKRCTLRFTQDVPDESSIGAYYQSEDYISHSDTKKGLINALYHLVRKRTISGKLSLIKKFTGIDKGSLLDIGAGTGAFASFMKKAGWNVTALEPDEAARVVASRTYDVTLTAPDQMWKLPSASFHAITMWHVLEHVHQLHAYLDKISSLLHESGKAFIAVPNYTSLDAAHYKSDWAAYDVPRHLYHFSPASMKLLLKKHGLVVVNMEPMWYDSFYVSMLSEKYRNGATKLPAAVITGIRSNARAIGNSEKCSSVIYIVEKEIQKRTS